MTDRSILPSPIASLMLEDLRRAALYLEELGDDETRPRESMTARGHALRLWAASQAVERLTAAVEQIVIQERSRRGWTDAES